MGALDYLLQFTYQTRYGLSKSTCYAESPAEVDERIKEHLTDNVGPEVIGYKVYMLVKEESVEREANNDKTN